MNRNIAIAIVLATAAAGSAFAESPLASGTEAFVSSTAARVQVQPQQPGANPWAKDYNPLAQFQSGKTRAQVSAEYVQSRDAVAAFTREDSGSAWLANQDGDSAPSRIAGQPRSAQ